MTRFSLPWWDLRSVPTLPHMESHQIDAIDDALEELGADRLDRDELTTRQNDVLTFLITTTRKTGIQPSNRDLCDHFGFKSPHAIHGHFLALAKKGWIAMPLKPKGTSRSPMRSIRFLRNLDGTPFHGWK